LAPEVRKDINRNHARGMSFEKIARELNARGIKTANGADWHGSTVQRVVREIGR
jgi:hypothetical protein